MKYKRLIVLSNTDQSHLGIGEYLRIASFLPNIKFEKIIWFSCKKLMPLVKEIEHLSKIRNFNQFRINSVNKNDLLINLTNNKILSPNTININDFSKKNKDFKKNTKNLLKLLSNKLKIKKYKIFTNKKITSKNKIFINWKVPKEWIIKSYPKKNWLEIIKKIKKKKDITIEWQKSNGDLKYLIKQIKESKIVISVVSLSCHLAILFGKKLITLSGPNFFDDLKLYNKSVVIFTKKKCKVHKDNMNVRYSKCNCMKFVDKEEVCRAVLNEI